MEAASRIDSGTWVWGLQVCIMDSPPLILKASCFYSWVHTDTRWPSPVTDTWWPVGFPGLTGNTKQPALHYLALWFRGFRGTSRCREGNWLKHNHQKGSRGGESFVAWPKSGSPETIRPLSWGKTVMLGHSSRSSNDVLKSSIISHQF